MDGWKMSFLLGFPIFRGYVKLWGGYIFFFPPFFPWTHLRSLNRFKRPAAAMRAWLLGTVLLLGSARAAELEEPWCKKYENSCFSMFFSPCVFFSYQLSELSRQNQRDFSGVHLWWFVMILWWNTCASTFCFKVTLIEQFSPQMPHIEREDDSDDSMSFYLPFLCEDTHTHTISVHLPQLCQRQILLT